MITDPDAAGDPVDSPEAWDELTAWLPEMLERLLGSETFDVRHRPPRGERGVYLFSEGEAHLYVGRTSITARSRRKAGEPGTSFRARYDQHIQPGQPPGASSFANRLVLEVADATDLVIPEGWWDNRKDAAADVYSVYRQAKERIGKMDCRIVTFLDDLKGVRSTAVELYVHAQLDTPYNDFSTS